MKRRLVIFVPFSLQTAWDGGSWLRFAGYTRTLQYIIADYTLYSPDLPVDFTPPHYLRCSVGSKWRKMMLLHNVCYANNWHLMARFVHRLIERRSHIAEMYTLGTEILLYTHQDATLACYLHLTRNIPYVYDVHGVFALQREYCARFGLKRKFLHWWYEKQEKFVFQTAPYINVVSAEMESYLRRHFNVCGNILLAPDGIPASLDKYQEIRPVTNYGIPGIEGRKVILFAGSLKPMGGWAELVKCYIHSSVLQSIADLVLIVTEKQLLDIRLIDNKHIHVLSAMPHDKLIAFMKTADVIVCPDIAENEYNRICPHIKFYDALATGTPVVATDLTVNRQISENYRCSVFYFSNATDSLEQAVIAALGKSPKQYEVDLDALTYQSRMQCYWVKYKEKLLDNE